jgi:GT2 family glycosyltransferase
VVADNGSTDETVARARSFADRIPYLTIVDASARVGANHARNRGAAVARGDLLAFCDADDVVSVDWLAALVDSAPFADLVGGWFEFDALSSSAHRGIRQPRPREPRLGFLPAASGTTCAVWKDVFDELGGMDEGYQACQDVEFSWRLQVSGRAITFEPRALAYHRMRATLRAAYKQAYKRGFARAQLFKAYRRHGMPRRSGRAVLTWGWLILTAPLTIVSSSRRGLWTERLGLRVGQLVGSFRHRTFYP